MGVFLDNIDHIINDIEREDRERADLESRDVGISPDRESGNDKDRRGGYAEGERDGNGSINFRDFESVDLRVARIIDVEDHTGSRKPMYKLTLSLGGLGSRVVVAGIKGFYSKDELIGKRVIIVANLEHKSIAGIVSEGMILAAEDEAGSVSLIVPDKSIEEGSRIR